MPTEKEPGYTKITAKPDEILSKVLQEQEIHQAHFEAQRKKRIELLKKIEAHDRAEGTKTGVIAFICSDSANASIGSEDIPAIGDALLSIGDVDRLDLIVDGPGGDGTIAEKVIDLCRCYCKTFRVIVPNRAKSAATIIALGTDEIVMGHTSEIGPIDAQVVIMAGGIPRFISAQSFIDAREGLEKRFIEASKNKEETKHILQQIAALDPPFIDHCEKLMGFSKQVAKEKLESHMFSALKPPERKKRIEKVLKGLSSVQQFKVHGRMINANAAKTMLELNVNIIPKDNPYWRDVWHYYLRINVMMAKNGVAKIIESRNELLMLPRSTQ